MGDRFGGGRFPFGVGGEAVFGGSSHGVCFKKKFGVLDLI